MYNIHTYVVLRYVSSVLTNREKFHTYVYVLSINLTFILIHMYIHTAYNSETIIRQKQIRKIDSAHLTFFHNNSEISTSNLVKYPCR